MTKKDYELIASAFRETKESQRIIEDNKEKLPIMFEALFSLEVRLSQKLLIVNNKFNQDKFLKACIEG